MPGKRKNNGAIADNICAVLCLNMIINNSCCKTNEKWKRKHVNTTSVEKVLQLLTLAYIAKIILLDFLLFWIFIYF